MAIGMAKQDGIWVRVYDEKNQMLFTKQGQLQGYTSGTVTVKDGNMLRMYDVKGNLTGSQFA